jgi:hypothetical protein
VALVALVAWAIVACGSAGAPTPTPGGFENFVAGLVQRGVTVTEQVAGDPGCPGSTLYSNAARFEVSLAGATDRHDVYFFAWRRASDYTAAAAEFDACVEAARQLNPSIGVTVFAVQPLRVYGPDWPPDLAAAVEQSLHEAAGN